METVTAHDHQALGGKHHGPEVRRSHVDYHNARAKRI